jgi:hypothetical protein
MGTTTKTLYDTDFVEWTAQMAQFVREGRFGELDVENLAEEIADLGKSDRSAVKPQLSRMLMHLVKEHIQPERAGVSWRSSVIDARREILYKVEDSPRLRRHLGENLQKIYGAAVRDALEETNLTGHARDFDIPKECPYTLDELLDGDVNALQRPRP